MLGIRHVTYRSLGICHFAYHLQENPMNDKQNDKFPRTYSATLLQIP